MDIDLDDPAAADSDMPPLLPARTSCKRPSRGDDLIVRMPDMSDDLDDIGAPDARPRSITARTFAFDGNGRMRKDKERRRKEGRDERKEKEREKVKEKVKVKTGKLPPLPQQQQYAPPHPSPPPPSDERQYWGPDDWGLDQDSIWEHEEMDASPSPTKGKGRARLPDAHQREREHDCAAGNENVFMDAVTDPTRSKYFPSPPPSNRVLVAESSPAGPGEPLSPYAAIPALSPAGSAGYTPALASPCSPVKRMRHNTLASPCPAARRARAPPVRAIEVIDLVSSSPAEDSGERASGVGVGAGSRAAAAGGSSAAQLFPPRAHARTKSGTLVDYLQLTDERGRPRKNLVSGDKIRHRAVPF
jgi:hypothetical protein